MKKHLIKIYNFVKYHLVKAEFFFDFENKHKIKEFKNRHLGEKCFIIGNGPSLKVEDLDKLQNQITFSCNMIYNTLSETKWRPYYYFVHDPKYVQEFSEDIQKVPCKNKFIGYYVDTKTQVKSKFKTKKNQLHYYIDKKTFSNKISKNFSKDVSKIVYSSGSVSYGMLQFAVYMGFSEIYLIGFDHTFSNQIKDGKLEKRDTKDHFSNYNVIPGNIVDVDLITQGFINANNFAKKNNIKIMNATRGGELEIFQRIDLNDVLK